MATALPSPAPRASSFLASNRYSFSLDQGKLDAHRTVAVDADGQVVGWCAVSPVSARQACSGVVENLVYVDPASAGGGVGGALLAHPGTRRDVALLERRSTHP